MSETHTSENPPRWPFKPELEISVPQTAALHQDEEGADFLLIDIREPEELAVASIGGAVHIPMGDIPAKINELDVDEGTTIAVICHTGRRSLQVTLYMQQQGLAGTRSVAGGIDWWSLRADPGVPRY